MEPILLLDLGSTFTKATAVDISEPRLLGGASAYTTAESDICIGIENALAELEQRVGRLDYRKRLACSSAAGGLRMVAVGLAPELTAKAASMASMGAGAKVVGNYSYELTEDDIDDITEKSPDILLLTGGTDGGNKKCVLHNAGMLAKAKVGFPIVVAGNRNCGREVMRLLADQRVYLCENVMPSIGTLNIEPARHMIREVFLERIVHAKGLSGVLMPTPAAVLAATELLASDIGELLAIDVGGATTDVYSMTDGSPRGVSVIYRGLPEPYAKRTVEGDIGMRYSAHGVVEAAGVSRIAELSGLSGQVVLQEVQNLMDDPELLPKTIEQKTLDFSLAAAAIDIATSRHAGLLEEIYTTAGKTYIQTGKDLTKVSKVIMTGGALLNTERQVELSSHALYNNQNPQSLRPVKADVLIDKHYIMAAMGLLSGCDPKAALKIMKEHIVTL